MSEINTTTEAVERLAKDICDPSATMVGRIEAAATLRALAGERDALRASNDNLHQMMALQRKHLAAADEAALTAARAEAARLRRGWLTTIQVENSCNATGAPCDAKRCGCVEEMEMLLREDDERAALTEAPRHD
jgi:hypothetical protein